MTNAPNHALQRTPGFGVQLPSAAEVRPAQSRAVRPAMKPGTARAFALRRRAHSRAPGPESLSLGSLGVATRSGCMKSFAAIFFLAFASCSSPQAPRTETWRWSNEEGDKPGSGFELSRTGSKLAVAMFVLDPNKPHDFSAGWRANTKLQRVEPLDIYFTVDVPPEKAFNVHLHLNSPLQGDTVKAVMGDTESSSLSPEFKLHRVQ